MHTYTKIVLPTRPQPDTIVGIFLLKAFGAKKYPGIAGATVGVLSDLPEGETEDSLSRKGVLLIDVGGAKFDHHNRRTTASNLIAEDLGIAGDPAISKLLKYAERDDQYGRGTISQDALDKAFGLSGLIASLNKSLPGNPQKVVDYTIPLLKAHYLEEKKRQELPKDFETALRNNTAEVTDVRHKGKNITVVALESDDVSMSGWLRSAAGPKADVVMQKTSSGYVNVLTRPMKRVDLRWPAALLRKEESNARKRGANISVFGLMRPGRVREAPEWYYDRATNSILNGGIIQKGVEATAIPWEMAKELVKEGLSVEVPKKKKAAVNTQPEISTYFMEVRIPPDAAQEIRGMIGQSSDGLKLHLPENYHITLMYLGEYGQKDIQETVERIEAALSQVRTLSLFVSSEHLRAGVVTGYPGKSFYFELKDENGASSLKQIWSCLSGAVHRFQTQEFIPHMTVATAMPNVEERVAQNASLVVKEERGVEFLVKKLRLTQVLTDENGRTSYRKKADFALHEM